MLGYETSSCFPCFYSCFWCRWVIISCTGCPCSSPTKSKIEDLGLFCGESISTVSRRGRRRKPIPLYEEMRLRIASLFPATQSRLLYRMGL
ncbi:unnamed protein product [Lactuca virosa]|uniref:Uncharacterized protein n=1 Tax=Lactuca virosa TaxID=75947 RepID=A0AAU9MD94_9ASTR|nr:unnamed protein product [Lactuca virosa]